MNNASSGSLIIGLPNDTQFGGAITLGLTGCLVLPLSISKMPIQHSPEKLLGKSPEYIRTYINAYEKQTRKLRENWGIAAVSGIDNPLLLQRLNFLREFINLLLK